MLRRHLAQEDRERAWDGAESEMRRLRTALSACDRPIPKGGDHPMGSPTTEFNLLPLGTPLGVEGGESEHAGPAQHDGHTLPRASLQPPGIPASDGVSATEGG